MNRFIVHFQVVNANKCNTISMSTLYNLLLWAMQDQRIINQQHVVGSFLWENFAFAWLDKDFVIYGPLPCSRWILHFIGSFQYKLKTYLFKITFNRDIILRFAPNSFASFLIHVALLDLITLKVLREKQILWSSLLINFNYNRVLSFSIGQRTLL